MPRVLGDYRLLGKLGQGGGGAVFRAYEGALDRQVAVKVLPPNKAADRATRAAFDREARRLAACRHRGIVGCHRYAVIDGYVVLAMELCERGDAEHELRRRGAPLAVDEVLDLAEDIAEGLDCLEHAGLVHGDIKPANILLRQDGSAVIADLGTAIEVAVGRGDGRIVGTPAYMAPEQARGQSLDVRTDLYALGATCYHLLSGRRPYAKDDPAVMLERLRRGPPTDLRHHRDDLPRPILGLVRRLMARDPGERFRSARSAVRAIRRVRELLAPAEAATEAPATTPDDLVGPGALARLDLALRY